MIIIYTSANSLRIHHNYMLENLVGCVDMMYIMISRKYLNNKYIQRILII